MNEPMLAVPVTCRTCGKETITEFPGVVIATALLKWNHMVLHASCHPEPWNASPSEMEQIREYAGVSWLIAHHPKTTRLSIS